MEFYHYYDYDSYGNGVQVALQTLYLIKETPKGYWISENAFYQEKYKLSSIYDKPKWVSKTAKKRYAYPTKLEALNSYKWRKKRQVEYASYTIGRAEQVIEQIDKIQKRLEDENKHNNRKDQSREKSFQKEEDANRSNL